MQELLQHQPGTTADFKIWCQNGISWLEGLLDGDFTPETRSFAAALVVRAKVHAYRITAYDLADVLPARDEKNPVDALLRLRECLEWLESGGPAKEPPPGVPLTVRQAARRMNVDDRTVYSLCRSGELAHHRIGNGRGTIRITPDELRRYLDRSRVAFRASETVEDHLFGPA